MRNLRELIIVLISLFYFSQTNAQCPIAAFTLPDTACQASPLNFQNNSTGSDLKFQWDFNANDMSLTPIGTSLGTFSSTIGSSLGIDVIKTGGNYYGVNMTLSGILSLLDFGTSLSNTPTVNNLGNIGGLSNPTDISIVEENGNFYALVNTLGGNIVRLEFGNSMTNVPTPVTINVSSSLFNTAYYHTIYKTPNETFMLVSNFSGGTITVINFGTTITNNNPSAGNISLPSSNPISVAVGSDCGDYFGFIGYASNSTISRIDFGSTISPSPIQVVSLNTAGQTAYREINLINDGYNWVLTAALFGGDILQQYSFGPALSNLSPVLSNYTGLSAFNSGCYAFTIKKFDSTIQGIVSNYNSGELTHFRFPESNSGAPFSSNDVDPIVTFNSGGYYYIHLTATDTISGKTDYYRDSVFIAALPISDFSYTNLCSGDQTQFQQLATSSQGNITQYNWEFGNGQQSTGTNPLYTYPAAGIYTISLEVITDLGCSDTSIKQAEVYTPPVAGFSFTDNQCMGAPVQFNDTSTSASGTIQAWTWYFNTTDTLYNQNPTYAWNNNGVYNITLITYASTGCQDTASAPITIIPGPIVDFIATRTCLGDSVNFKNNTNIPSSITTQYLWAFGDGANSTDEAPIHSYSSTASGDYNVILIALGSNSCNDTLSQLIHVGLPALPDFTLSADSICVANPLNLNNTSLIPFGESEVNKYWDFGNGDGDTTMNQTQALYNVPGNYLVTLTIETNTSCRASIQKPIAVIANPSASFTVTNACLGLPIQFNNTSSTPSGTILTNWNWNFGDNDTTTIPNPTHIYATADTFITTLVVTHNLGCKDSIQIPAITHQKPNANFSVSKACSNQLITFNDSSTVGDGSLVQWSWDFGDGSTTNTLQNPQHTYTTSAAYQTKLIATSSNGCSDTISKMVVVYESPEYQLTGQPVCFGTSYNYSISFTSTPISNAGYLWNFGDATATSQPLPTHFFNQPGVYTTELTITNLGNGCATTRTTNSIVYANPKAGFTHMNVCSGQTFQPSDTSISSDGLINSWLWTAGSYGNFSTPSIQINALTADTFPLKLIITTIYGCKDSITKSLITYGLPSVSFNTDVTFGSPPLTVQYTNTSSVATYTWDFGDGSALSTLQNPSHIYADTGIFETKLIVVDSNGCIDSTFKKLYVLIPRNDLAILAVSFTLTNNQWVLSAQLRNEGNTTIENADIMLTLQYQNPIVEHVGNLNLIPSQTRWVTMGVRYPSEGMPPPKLLCSEILKINDEVDQYTSNNKQCKSIEDGFVIYPAYPNPGSGLFLIPISSNEEKEISMRLHNNIGQLVLEEYSLEVKKGFNTFELDISSFPSGMYLLKVLSGEIEKNIRLQRY